MNFKRKKRIVSGPRSWNSSLQMGMVLGLLALMTGCGQADHYAGKRAGVTGYVQVDGSPLKKGNIQFVPIEGTPGPKTIAQVSDGVFAIDPAYGPVVGKHRIEIQSDDTGGYAFDDEQAFEKMKRKGITKLDVQTVPPQYNTQSQIVREISRDEMNDFMFELSSNTSSR